MKALLICPGIRPAVAALSRRLPLACHPVAGTTLLEAWLEHLSILGATEVLVLATDRPERVRQIAGDGARWGLQVTVFPELRERTLQEAVAKYRAGEDGAWLDSPHDVTLMDHFPGHPDRSILTGYPEWWGAVRSWVEQSVDLLPAGLREVRTGVFVGARARIHPTATLIAPCWVGNDVRISAGAVVGPDAIIEDRSSVGRGCRVADSQVGPETLLGPQLQVEGSIAWGSRLTRISTGSSMEVPDPFLMQPLMREPNPDAAGNLFGRLMALVLILATAPLSIWAIFSAKLRGRPALTARVGVRYRDSEAGAGGDFVTYVYAEFTAFNGLLKRLPQLWNVARGEFAWVGNRPLSPGQAAELTTDFERLWLRGAAGLVSLGDARGVPENITDESRAHASFYAVNSSWRMDADILTRVASGPLAPR